MSDDEVRIPINLSEAAGVRYLHFGSEWIQGAMRIRRPVDLELAYTREMMAGLLMRDDPTWPRNALLIGLGAGSLTKFCYHKLPQTQITVVEICEAVCLVAQQYFKLPDEDDRLTILIDDGVDYMAKKGELFDLILVDGYDENAHVGLLDSLPFYRNCHKRLSESGLLATNLFGRTRRYEPSLKRLAEAFEGRALAFPSVDAGNVVAFAARGEAVDVPLAELRRRATELRANTGLDLRPTLTRIERARILPGDRLTF